MDGWSLINGEGIALDGRFNVTKSTRVVLEGRFRPVEDAAIICLELVFASNEVAFSQKYRLTETVKLGFAFDGKTRSLLSSRNEQITSEPWKYIGPAHDLQVQCVAIRGFAECDWIACAEGPA